MIPGNLPTSIRNKVRNADGTISTVRTISIGTDAGEVLIPTVVGGKVLSDRDAIRHFERTGENFGTFSSPAQADAYAEALHNYHASLLSKGSPRPVSNAAVIADNVYPGIQITQMRRDPQSALGRANPDSWHNRTGAAIDARPIRGMTFEQYVQGYRNAGHKIIEARDEVKNPSKHATGPHWHVVLGE